MLISSRFEFLSAVENNSMLAGTHSRLHSDTITLPNKEEQLTFQLLHSRTRRRDAISTRSTRVSDESI